MGKTPEGKHPRLGGWCTLSQAPWKSCQKGIGGRPGFLPGSIAKGSSSKSGCKLHLPTSLATFPEFENMPTSPANLSRVKTPANFLCQLFESYFNCQLPTPTFRELLHLLTSHANFSRATSPANFSCKSSRVTSPASFVTPTFRVFPFTTSSLDS